MKDPWKIEQSRQRKLAEAQYRRERREWEDAIVHSSTDYYEMRRKYKGIPIRDLSGYVFGQLTVIKKIDPHITPDGKRMARYLCQCSCGDIAEVYGYKLVDGDARSCGCNWTSVKEKVEPPEQLTPYRELDPSADLSFQPLSDPQDTHR